VVVALAAGVIAAPVGTAVRALWSTAVAEADERRAGFALLTLVGEAGFLGGPLLAAAVVAVASTTAAVAVTAALGLGAAVVVAAASPRRGPLEPGARGARGPGPLRDAAVRGVVATAGCFGAAFGVLDLTLPAAARAAGTPALGGVLLAAVAAGIAVGGAVYGARSGAGPVRPVYARYSLLAAAGLAPLALLPPPAGLAALSLLAGACFGPITVVQNSVIDEIAPSAVAETYSWLATLYGTGAAAGAALAGQLVERVGLRAAPVAAVVVMAGAVVVARRTVGWRA
jgi:MFS-type transporter involved in bile tolerance (Atg22 family)